MTSKPINVLVYAGKGAGPESLRLSLFALRGLLSPTYAVSTVTGDVILKEPWAASCALLVIPGGADLPYCETLNGEGNRKIQNYVRQGGKYLGFCAGGYYGSKRCEFEVGDKVMEVTGERELGFYPGTCRGSAFKGFRYNSESGTRAAELKVEHAPFGAIPLPKTFRTYCNGGGVFANATALEADGIEVLARYTESLDIDDEERAAIVYCKVGSGAAILTGPHPEFAGSALVRNVKGMQDEVVDTLVKDDEARTQFLRACLSKIGLEVNQSDSETPSLSPWHLSSSTPARVSEIRKTWQEVIVEEGGAELVQGGRDIFQLHRQSAWSVGSLAEAFKRGLSALSASQDTKTEESAEAASQEEKLNVALVVHESEFPSREETPAFNHSDFFNLLKSHTANWSHPEKYQFGHHLIYGEVVTSTNTMLEKNPAFTAGLPQGSTFTATTQLAGRGRGSNVWISPAGTLLFSTIIKHPLAANAAAPVVFIQYLAAVAIAEGIRNYRPAPGTPESDLQPYASLPVRLKWPNDIYALDPQSADASTAASHLDSNERIDPSAYTKIGGILVNLSYTDGDYTLIVGIGLNVSNSTGPTTSLNTLLRHFGSTATSPSPQPIALESLLASILTNFERLYGTFCEKGWAGELEELYYSYWLHSGQIVHVETEGNMKARVKGITRDWGLLLVEEVEGQENTATGRMSALQSDSNSFDFFKGLLKRKL